MTAEGDAAQVGAAVAILVENEADIAAVAAGGGAPAAAAPAPAAAAPAPAAEAAAPAADALAIEMPALSSTMTEGKIVQWLKGVGDKVEAGDAIMVVESDKADMDVEAFEEGYIAKIITPEGEMAAVGAAVALLAETEDQIAAVAAGGAPAAAAAAPAAAAPAPAAAAPAPAAAAPAAAPVNSGEIQPRPRPRPRPQPLLATSPAALPTTKSRLDGSIMRVCARERTRTRTRAPAAVRPPDGAAPQR